MSPPHPPLPDYTPIEPSADFAAGVLKRVHRNRFHRKVGQHSVNLMLFMAVVAIGTRDRIAGHFEEQVPDTLVQAQQGVNWLIEHQNDAGHWEAEDWGGHEAFTPGVSALATLALLHSPDPAPAASTENALAFLQKQVRQTSFAQMHGPEFYNYLLSLNTLLEAESLAPESDRKQLIRKSLADLIRRQQPSGGWGYAEDQPLGYGSLQKDNANSAITWWVCYLLDKGKTLQVEGRSQALAKGEAWLDQRFQSAEQIAYQANSRATAEPKDALFWMAARMITIQEDPSQNTLPPDAYRDALRVSALQNPVPPEVVIASTATRPVEGRDRWWKAGGQVYVTAAQVISLVPRGGV